MTDGNSAPKQSGGSSMWIFGLIWTLGIGLVDLLILYSMVQRLRSLGYEAVPCVIIKSEVREEPVDYESSYFPEVSFTYSVDGQQYSSDRIRAGGRQGLGKHWSRRIISRYPVGAHATAWFNPAHPADAVLQRGLDEADLFVPLVLAPFNVIMIVGWWWFLRDRRFRKKPPLAGGVKLLVTSEGTRARLTTTTPLFPAGVALFAFSFLGVFFGFAAIDTGSLALMLGAWAMVLGAPAAVYVYQRRRDADGDQDLLLHADGQHVTLPENCGRTSSVTISREDIADAIVLELYRPNADSDSSPNYYPALVLRHGEQLQLVRWVEREVAVGFTAWLRAQLQLAPSPVGAGEAPNPG